MKLYHLYFLLFVLCLPVAAAGQVLSNQWQIYIPTPGTFHQLRGELHWDKQPESYLALGKYYLLGEDTKKDLAKAKRYLKKAAKQDIEAQLLLALLPLEEKKVSPKQEKQMFQQVEKLARQDYAPAFYALALLYHKGKGVDKDPAAELKWLTRAAQAPTPVPAAQNQLAVYYYEGFAPYIQPDLQHAFALFLAAAEAEDKYASYNAANLYIRGEGTEKNEKRGFHFMLQAARRGLVEAQLAVSDLYRQGIGTKADAYGAFHWTLKAARKNNRQAQQQTALNYLRGNGVAVNHAEALKWAEKAKQNGSQQADELIRQIQNDL